MHGSISDWLHQRFNLAYKLSVRYDTGTGPPIVLLHGIASNSSVWWPLTPFLIASHRCVAIDLLGFGDSPKPSWTAYSIDDHVASIHRTLKGLGLTGKQYILIGHSMGGLLAAHYARLYPEEVKQLYMLSPPIMTSLPNPEKPKRTASFNAYGRAYRYVRRHKKFTLTGAKRMMQLLKNPPFSLSEENWLPFVRSLEECIEKQNAIDHDLTQLRCPIEVFYGRRDHVINLTNVRSLKIIPNVTLHELSGWHRLSVRYAQLVARSILSVDGQ